MGEAVKMVESARKEKVLPVFISVDPARDGVKEVKKYIGGTCALAGLARSLGEKVRLSKWTRLSPAHGRLDG